MPSLAPTSLPIIVLAAGLSSRMRGRDKLMEPVDGVPLLARQVQRASAATDGQVFVALPPKPHPRHDALKGMDVVPVDVPDAANGMSVSLRAALTALPAGASAAMILLPDLPDIASEDMRRVMASVDFDGGLLVWRGTTEDGTPGHPVVIAARLFEEFKCLSGDTGGAEILKLYQSQTCLIPLPGSRARRDLDTPEDWADWRASQSIQGQK